MTRDPGRALGVTRWWPPALLLAAALATALLAGCRGGWPPDRVPAEPAAARGWIDRALPRPLAGRPQWADAMAAGFASLGIAATHENVCAVVAVIEQESGFQVEPVIPDLPSIAWREIDERAAHAGLPALIVHGVLGLPSPTGRSYRERIDGARTEKQLSDVYEDFIAAVPLGRTLFADRNPIRTRGPMQVHVNFAEQFAATHRYPYPVASSIADEVFTRRGGVYFGIAHLLDYTAPYDRYLFRFADFNAGQYASRNAAFQFALATLAGTPLAADGALLPHDGTTGEGATEHAARALAPRLGLGADQIHAALELGKGPAFERTELYQRVFAAAGHSAQGGLPRARIPAIELHGPKLKRRLTTEWYANRVNQRFERCLRR